MESNKLEVQKNKILILFQEKKDPMQSASVSKNLWIGVISSEDESGNLDYIDDIMNWNGSADMAKQVKLHFVSLDDAKIYAKKYGYTLCIKKNAEVIKKPVKKSYLEKFM